MQQKKTSTATGEETNVPLNMIDRPPLVGLEIQRLRQEHHLTLDELATKSGVSKSILSQIERDHT